MQINTQKLKRVSLYTLIFWVITHGYRFTNNLYTGDTMCNVFQDDIMWQRSLGRFMQPLTMVFRGTIVAPWLLFGLSIVLFSLSTYLISEMLGIEKPLLLFITCGVFTCNSTILCANAVYTPWIDIYGTSLLLVTLGVWLFLKDKWWGYLAGIVCFVCAMGFYQSYIDVAFALFFIIVIGDLARGDKVGKVLVKVGKIAGGLLIAGVGYYATYKLIIKVHHVMEAVSYNSLAGVGDFEGTSILSLVGGAYREFFNFLTNQGTFVSTYLLGIQVSRFWGVLVTLCVWITIIFILVALFVINRKNKTAVINVVLQAACILLFPLAANFVYVITKGFEYELMVFSFLFVFVGLIVLVEKLPRESKVAERKQLLLLVPIVVMIWNNIVFSNQNYFKIDMQNEAALSMATRIVNDVENFEDYEPGKTPVEIIGFMPYSSSVNDVPYIRELYVHGNYKSVFTYLNSLSFYINNYLAVDMNIVHCDEDSEYTADMPVYPAKGSMRYIDGKLVIKISEPRGN